MNKNAVPAPKKPPTSAYSEISTALKAKLFPLRQTPNDEPFSYCYNNYIKDDLSKDNNCLLTFFRSTSSRFVDFYKSRESILKNIRQIILQKKVHLIFLF